MWRANSDKRTKAGPTIVSVADARDHLRLCGSEHDGKLSRMVRVAQDRCERMTNRAFTAQSRVLLADRFPANSAPLVLPYGPAIDTTSVDYWDEDLGDYTPWDSSNYRVETIREPGYVVPNAGIAWPIPERTADAVRVTYDCGMTSGHELWEQARQCVLLLVAETFENPDTVEELDSSTLSTWLRPLSLEPWPGQSAIAAGGF